MQEENNDTNSPLSWIKLVIENSKLDKNQLEKALGPEIEKLEKELNKISTLYTSIFDYWEWEKSKKDLLEEALEEARSFIEFIEKEDTSIESIESKHNKIKWYYNKIFDWVEEESSIKDDIDAFYNKIFSESWYESKIDDFYSELEEKYDYILWENWHALGIESFYKEYFKKWNDWSDSKIKQTKDNIDAIKDGADYLLWKKWEDWKRWWESISSDIEELKAETIRINNENKELLEKATASSIMSWYSESKNSYSNTTKWDYLILFLNYLLFLAPLIAIILYYTYKWEFVIKEIVSNFPLIFLLGYISFVWQKNISNRNKLYEEYNHKYQVAKMFNSFNINKKEDKLDLHDKEKFKQEMNEKFIETVFRNPSNIYWKEEWIIDKIIKIFTLTRDKMEDKIKPESDKSDK